VLVKILTVDAPSITSERRTVPPHVAHALARALEKLPADRFTSAAEFAAALADESFTYKARTRTSVATSEPQPVAAQADTTVSGPWNRLTIATTTLAVLLAGLAAWGWLAPPPALQPTLSVIALDDITLGPTDEIIVSPDGSRFATVGAVDGQVAIYWRNAAEEHFRLVPGTEDARFVAFSPDGEWLVYRSLVDDALTKVSLSGGAPSVVVPAALVSPRDPHWGDDGTIVFTGPQGQGLYRVPDTGGEPELLLPGRFRTPRLLPGGRGVIVAEQNGPSVVLLDLETDSVRTLFPGALDPMYVETGHILYADPTGQLWAAAFDVRRSEVTSQPVPVLGGVFVSRNTFARYSVSRHGTLVYGAGGAAGVGPGGARQLVVVDLEGNEEVPPLDPRSLLTPRWSPNGESVVYAEPLGRGLPDIYTYNVVLGTTPRRLTFEGSNIAPVWSPDGTRIAFASDRDGAAGLDLFVKNVTDDAAPELVVTRPGLQYPTHWPSDDLLLFEDGLNPSDLWMVDLSGDSAVARPYLEAEADLDEVRLSPRGDLAAYTSDESTNRGEVYVRSFPEPRQPEIVSQGGGVEPFWSPDGNTIYYWTPAPPDANRTLMAARIERGPPFVVLSRDTVLTGVYGDSDLHPDGDRIVTWRPAGSPGPAATGGASPEPERFLLITNWFEELRQRMGN
jgi:serine/threonine-protein kinase